MTPEELNRLAHAAAILRPDWPVASIRTYLERHHAARPLHDTAVALAWIATDPDIRTPAKLNDTGPWWRCLLAERDDAGPPLPPPVAEVLVDREAAAPPDPERIRQIAAQARAELDERLAGRAYHQPEGADT